MINCNFLPRCFQFLLIESSKDGSEVFWNCSICAQRVSPVTRESQLDRDERFKIPTYWHHDRLLHDISIVSTSRTIVETMEKGC